MAFEDYFGPQGQPVQERELSSFDKAFMDVPGATPENPAQEQTVSAQHRHFAKMYGDSPQQVANGLTKLGYDAKVNSRGEVAVRKNVGQKWGVVDPSGWQGFGELGKDVMDFGREAGDVAATVGGALVGTLGGPAGTAVGGVAGAFAYETARQFEGQRLGFKDDFEWGNLALSTGLAALPSAKYVPGVKQAGGAIAKVGKSAMARYLPGLTKSAVYGVGEEVAETGLQKVGRGLVGAGEVLEAPGRALTKVGERVLQGKTAKQFENAYDMVTTVVNWADDLGLPKEMIRRVERQAMRLKLPGARFPSTFGEIDNAVKEIADSLLPELQKQVQKNAQHVGFGLGKAPVTKELAEQALERVLRVTRPEQKKMLEKIFGLPFQALGQRLLGRFGGPLAGFAYGGASGAIAGAALKAPGLAGAGLRWVGWKLVDRGPEYIKQLASAAPPQVAQLLKETAEVMARNPTQRNIAINSLLMNATVKSWLQEQLAEEPEDERPANRQNRAPSGFSSSGR